MQKILTHSTFLKTVPIHIQNLSKRDFSVLLPPPGPGKVRLFRATSQIQMPVFPIPCGYKRFRVGGSALRMEKKISFKISLPTTPYSRRLQNTKPSLKTSFDVLLASFQKKAMSHLSWMVNRSDMTNGLLKIAHSLPPEILPGSQTLSGKLRHTLLLSPGEAIVIEAAFQRRDTPDSWMSPFVLNEIDCSKVHAHDGFPFPSERVGWGLSSICLPNLSDAAKNYPLFHGIKEKQRLAQQTLLDKTPLYFWAQENYLLRRRIFDQDTSKWLKHHQVLLETFIHCVDPSKELFFQYRSIIQHFLKWAATMPSPFEAVTQVHQRMLRLFIEIPYQRVQQLFPSIWTSFSKNPLEKSDAMKALLRKTAMQVEPSIDRTHPVGVYLALIGPKLAKIYENFILQSLFEKIGIPPPTLSRIERRLQICALQHLLSFLENLERKPLSFSEMVKQMEREMEEDVHALTGTKVHRLLAWGGTQELEAYFLHRHQQLLCITPITSR